MSFCAVGPLTQLFKCLLIGLTFTDSPVGLVAPVREALLSLLLFYKVLDNFTWLLLDAAVGPEWTLIHGGQSTRQTQV